jgi:AcrR family transcriptional regulator
LGWSATARYDGQEGAEFELGLSWQVRSPGIGKGDRPASGGGNAEARGANVSLYAGLFTNRDVYLLSRTPTTPGRHEDRAGSSAPAGRSERDSRIEERERRLIDALTRSAAAKGFEATTIQDIASGAGVAKRTFYLHFADKQACLEAALDQFLTEARMAIDQAIASESSWSDSVVARITALLELLSVRPGLANLAFLETSAGNGAAPGEPTAGERALEMLFEATTEQAPADADLKPAAERAALGGVQALVIDQLIAGRAGELPDLLDEFIYIVLVPYVGREVALRHSAEAARAREDLPPASERLPGGRHGLSSELVTEHQRRRLLDAMTNVAAAKGYAATSVAELLEVAGVSRTTFYELFEDKEDCLLAAHQAFVEELLRVVLGSCQHDLPWPERVRYALAALLDRLAAEPPAARLALVEISAAGPVARRQHRDALMRFASLLEGSHGGREIEPRPSRHTARAAVGAAARIINSEIQAGHAEQLPDVLPEVLFATLVPVVGPDRAAAERDKASDAIG